MTVLRTSSRGAGLARFGIAAAIFILNPTGIGYQDLAALLAQEPAVSARWRQHLLTSLGTLRAASFSFPNPIGAAIPQPLVVSLTDSAREYSYREKDEWLRSHDLNPDAPTYHLASVTPEPSDGLASWPRGQDLAFHPLSVNRAGKGDFLAPRNGSSTEEDEKAAERTNDEQDGPTMVPDGDLGDDEHTARLLFGERPLGAAPGVIEPWHPGEAPVLDQDAAVAQQHASLPQGEAISRPAGETIASKGEVTGDEKRPMTAAERMGLSGKTRLKAERCLTDAIYFESRGEPTRGQVAVAQVVINRAFSGYYPEDICGVVYQNANRKLACQFTFACDGIPERVTDKEAWQRATAIARDALDGKLWLPDVGKSTHYHATYVRPRWARSMRKLSKIGVHMFYRPHDWGPGDEIPAWGEATAQHSSKL